MITPVRVRNIILIYRLFSIEVAPVHPGGSHTSGERMGKIWTLLGSQLLFVSFFMHFFFSARAKRDTCLDPHFFSSSSSFSFKWEFERISKPNHQAKSLFFCLSYLLG